MSGAARVALVEDHALLAESLLLALSLEGFEVEVVPLPQSTTNAADLLHSILDLKPKVVLLDLDLGVAGDGTVLVEPLSRAGCLVVVVTASGDLARWGECLAHGARKVLAKSTPLHDIVDMIRRVTEGLPVIEHANRVELIERWHRRQAEVDTFRTRLDALTRREAQVLSDLIQGNRVRDIATAAYVSEATVRTQVKSILTKLGVTSQIAAVAVAREAGWGPSYRSAS
jgi:two-component system nitrate/nitrite response regulator NarL